MSAIDDIVKWFIKRRKAKGKTINKRYYLVCYIGLNNTNGWLVGHCTIEATYFSLSTLSESIQKENGLKNPATIITLKDLTKEEYNMLNGKQDGN